MVVEMLQKSKFSSCVLYLFMLHLYLQYFQFNIYVICFIILLLDIYMYIIPSFILVTFFYFHII